MPSFSEHPWDAAYIASPSCATEAVRAAAPLLKVDALLEQEVLVVLVDYRFLLQVAQMLVGLAVLAAYCLSFLATQMVVEPAVVVAVQL